MNTVEVCGRLQGDLCLSHETRSGKKMYTGKVLVTRLSGVQDEIPITVPIWMVQRVQTQALYGRPVMLKGQLRSYVWGVDGKGQTRVMLHVQEAESALESTTNNVQLTGTISRAPVFRSTPFGRRICDVMLIVKRAYGKNSYIPCVAWGYSAELLSKRKVGDQLTVFGRIQSREYEKVLDGGEKIKRTVQEVSIFRMDMEGKTSECKREGENGPDILRKQ